MLFIVCVTVHFDLKKTFARDQACLMSCFIFSCQEYNVKKQSIQTSNSVLMYRSNRSFNMPPRATPRAFDFFENYCSNSPTTRAKMPFKCPTLGSIQVIKCPHRGDISQAQKWQKDDERTHVKFTRRWKSTLRQCSHCPGTVLEYGTHWALM